MRIGDITQHVRRAGSFLVVGGVGFVVDAAVYNALVFWGGKGWLYSLPLVAKVISISVASIVTYIGNHLWTFHDRRPKASLQRFLLFSALNVGAILLQLGCLGFSRYVLGLAGPVADNVSGTLIGQIVATAFRYVTYSRWVFPAERVAEDAAEPAVR